MPHRLASVLLLALGAAAAQAGGIDVEIGNGDKVTGTLSPATEVETFRVRVPAGAKLAVKAKAAKKGPALHVTLTETDGGTSSSTDGKSASISAVATKSGIYTVTIASQNGTSTGDYSLSIAWKSVTSFSKTADLATGQSATLTFGADAGATATITAKPAKKSPAVAALLGLTSPDAAVVALTGKTVKRTLTLGGDHVLEFGYGGATAGGVVGTVKLKLPKASKRPIVLTAKAIGSGSAMGDAATAAVIGAAGGTVTVPAIPPTEAGSAISGSSVAVPPGAFQTATAIFIATSPAVEPPVLTGAAGPAVAFGPDGTRFDKTDKDTRATLTIPYSAAFDASLDQLVVYTRDAKGKVTTVPPPYSFDLVHHTVSFPTSHFSSYQLRSPDGQVTGPQMVTLATGLGDARDLMIFTSQSAIGYLVAGGTSKTLISLTANLSQQGPLFDQATFAGGGTSTVDGTTRLQFRFDDPVTAVVQFGLSYWVSTTRQIFLIDENDQVSLYAGTGATGSGGDNGPALSATFTSINSMVFDSNQGLIICDGGANRIRSIDYAETPPTVHAYAGTGSSSLGADAIPPGTTTFLSPNRICAALLGGGIYVADGGRVRHIDPVQGTNVTVAGDENGATGATGDGGTLLAARFTDLRGIAAYLELTPAISETILVTDAGDHTVRRLGQGADVVTLVAGQHGTAGDAGQTAGPTGLLDTPGAMVALSLVPVFLDQSGSKIREVVPGQ